ncbi:MAG: hypothetical protein H6648_09990 [Caldilineae bacterium]|nr:hypothetical protein [Chloroflexota bacterium]MCB9177480.1 hypothetical protein [Caldilineae bacterium]
MVDSIFQPVLVLHSLLRWAVVVLLALALLSALRGWLGRRSWSPSDDKLGRFLTMSADLQLLLGLLLYAISPITVKARADMGAAMADAQLRYWSVEHFSLMLVAIVLIHVGRARSRRAIDAVLKHKQAAIFFGLAALALLVGVPWPFLPNGRPWLPF